MASQSTAIRKPAPLSLGWDALAGSSVALQNPQQGSKGPTHPHGCLPRIGGSQSLPESPSDVEVCPHSHRGSTSPHSTKSSVPPRLVAASTFSGREFHQYFPYTLGEEISFTGILWAALAKSFSPPPAYVPPGSLPPLWKSVPCQQVLLCANLANLPLPPLLWQRLLWQPVAGSRLHDVPNG